MRLPGQQLAWFYPAHDILYILTLNSFMYSSAKAAKHQAINL